MENRLSRFLAGIIFYTREVLFTSHYKKNDYLTILASLVLPTQILDYFLTSGVEQSSQEIHISLDEKINTKLSHDAHFESKGFMEAVNATDFLILIRSSFYSALLSYMRIPTNFLLSHFYVYPQSR